MGIATFPSFVSPVKSIQRGVAAAAGDITISAVNTLKTITNSFPTSADGTVAATGTVSAATGNAGSSTVYIDGYAGSGIGFSSQAPSPIFTGNYNNPNVSAYNASNSAYNSPTQYFLRYTAPYNAPTQYFNTPYASAYNSPTPVYSNTLPTGSGNMTQNGQSITLNSTTISGGSTNLFAGAFGIYLKNSTTITATGPCRYEVIEYY